MQAFLEGRIGFLAIADVVERVLERCGDGRVATSTTCSAATPRRAVPRRGARGRLAAAPKTVPTGEDCSWCVVDAGPWQMPAGRAGAGP